MSHETLLTWGGHGPVQSIVFKTLIQHYEALKVSDRSLRTVKDNTAPPLGSGEGLAGPVISTVLEGHCGGTDCLQCSSNGGDAF